MDVTVLADQQELYQLCKGTGFSLKKPASSDA